MREIELTQGQVAIVDDEDYEYLSSHKWCAAFDPSYNSYKAMNIDYSKKLTGAKTVLMHRLIMKLRVSDDVQVDHINHNTLDNRKENLRLVTASQNCMNTRKRIGTKSNYKGVRYSYSRNRKKHWSATIEKDGVRYSLGCHMTEIEAAYAYDKKARELFGEFAKLNFEDENAT